MNLWQTTNRHSLTQCEALGRYFYTGTVRGHVCAHPHIAGKNKHNEGPVTQSDLTQDHKITSTGEPYCFQLFHTPEEISMLWLPAALPGHPAICQTRPCSVSSPQSLFVAALWNNSTAFFCSVPRLTCEILSSRPQLLLSKRLKAETDALSGVAALTLSKCMHGACARDQDKHVASGDSSSGTKRFKSDRNQVFQWWPKFLPQVSLFQSKHHKMRITHCVKMISAIEDQHPITRTTFPSKWSMITEEEVDSIVVPAQSTWGNTRTAFIPLLWERCPTNARTKPICCLWRARRKFWTFTLRKSSDAELKWNNV